MIRNLAEFTKFSQGATCFIKYLGKLNSARPNVRIHLLNPGYIFGQYLLFKVRFSALYYLNNLLLAFDQNFPSIIYSSGRLLNTRANVAMFRSSFSKLSMGEAR